MDADTVIRRRADMAHSSMGDEVVILSNQTSRYLGLDGVGARVWELIAEPKSITEILDTLGNEYDVNEDKLASDVQGFIYELHEKQLIQIEGTP